MEQEKGTIVFCLSTWSFPDLGGDNQRYMALNLGNFWASESWLFFHNFKQFVFVNMKSDPILLKVFGSCIQNPHTQLLIWIWFRKQTWDKELKWKRLKSGWIHHKCTTFFKLSKKTITEACLRTTAHLYVFNSLFL